MNITAALLAGGESRRMGKDKATIFFHGRPLWQCQLDLLRQIGAKEIFVSARTDVAWRPPDCQLVVDEPPFRGPLSGVAASLSKMRTSHLLVLAIDMPFMTAERLCSLCRSIGPGSGIVPFVGNDPEPLAAIYPREAQIDSTTALRGSDFSMRSFVTRLLAADRLSAFAANGNGPAVHFENARAMNSASAGEVGLPISKLIGQR